MRQTVPGGSLALNSRARSLLLLAVICAAFAYPTAILNIMPPVDQMSGNDAEFWLVALRIGIALAVLGVFAVGLLVYLLFRDRRYGGGRGRGGRGWDGDDNDGDNERRGRPLPQEAYSR